VQHRLKQGEYRLPRGVTSWPTSGQVPTLWYFWSILWVWRYLNLLDPKRVEKVNDLPDFLTYRDAAYANIFVTDDRRLRAYIERCPEPKVRVMRFAEWAKTV
jgi:hypothetical protein